MKYLETEDGQVLAEALNEQHPIADHHIFYGVNGRRYVVHESNAFLSDDSGASRITARYGPRMWPTYPNGQAPERRQWPMIGADVTDAEKFPFAIPGRVFLHPEPVPSAYLTFKRTWTGLD